MAENYSLEEVYKLFEIYRKSLMIEDGFFGDIKYHSQDSHVKSLESIVILRNGLVEVLAEMESYPEVFRANIDSYKKLLVDLEETSLLYTQQVHDLVLHRKHRGTEFDNVPLEQDEGVLDDDLPF